MVTSFKKYCFLLLNDKYLHLLMRQAPEDSPVYQKVLIEDIKHSNHQLIQIVARSKRYLILPASAYRMLIMPRPDVPERFLNEAVKWQLVEKFNFDMTDAWISYHFTDETKENLLVAVSPFNEFNPLIEKFNQIGLTLQGVFPLDAVFAHTTDLLKEKNGIVIHFDDQKLSVMLVRMFKILDIVYVPNIHDPDLIAKTSLIIKTMLDKHSVSLHQLPVIYSELGNIRHHREAFEARFHEWGAIFYDIHDYIQKQIEQPDIDDHFAVLFVAMQYSRTTPLGKSDLNFYGGSNLKRLPVKGVARIVNDLLMFASAVVTVVVLYNVSIYISTKQTFNVLMAENRTKSIELPKRAENDTIALRIDQQTLQTNQSLYDWLLPISESIQKAVWVNSVQITLLDGKFVLFGGTFSSENVLRFVDKLQKHQVYSKIKLTIEEEKKPTSEDYRYESQQPKPVYHPPVEAWILLHPEVRLPEPSKEEE